jgi:dihydrofolate reductase
MRKLKLQVQMTVDGFIAGPNGEMDWMTLPWTEDVNRYVTEITDSVDTLILGRKLAEGFIPYWASVAANPDGPDFTAGKKFTDIPKVVFTRTLQNSAWGNTVLAKGDLIEEITRLKSQEGKDIIAYGGATFVSSLIRYGLIDELHLFINPSILGSGLTIFQEVGEKVNLTLQAAIPFACGITVMRYSLNKKQN